MRWPKTILGTGLVTLAVWLIMAWPLPRYVTTGVPAAALHAPARIVPMVPGDHLQFMYYCWLAGDWLTGRTPAFYNLYEFNTGDPRACFHPDTYYIPFSLIFNTGAWLGGRAFGWNLTGFVSLWLTYLLTLLLTRRYARDEWTAWLAALLGILLPYRWVNLFGGSPAGFAMMWPPAVLLGVELAVRDGRRAGGWLAGFALLGAAWGDQHVFFFSSLAAAGGGIVAFAAREERPFLTWNYCRRTCLLLLPCALLLGFALVFPRLMKWLTEFVSGLPPADFSVGPRSQREVLNYSPEWPGYWGRSGLGVSDQIYLGYTMTVLLVLGWLAGAWQAFRAPQKYGRIFVVLTLLGLGTALVMALALGYRGPRHAKLYHYACRLIPPYALIRQPAKILSLLPTLLAVETALACVLLGASLRSARWRRALPAVVITLLLWEYTGWTRPVISRLATSQGAYAAVAADAAQAGVVPHALVITLWPGDSHYASLYQHYASLYRMRMVNGYNPFIKKGYFEDVFRRFESVNQGFLAEDQFDRLREIGVGYLLFHEDQFPEKVSPFPAAGTLKNLLTHPRLALLQQDGPVWAFRILDTARPHPDPVPDWKLFFPARRWEAERCVVKRSCTVQQDEAAGGLAYATLSQTNSTIALPPERLPGRPTLRWLLRARGQGELRCAQLVNVQPVETNALAVQAERWTWLSLPVTTFTNFALLGLTMERQSGSVDLDTVLLVDGDWQPPASGQALTLPAAIFFHSGYSDSATGSAVFRASTEGPGMVFYGPKLPLEPGLYEIAVDYASPAAAGTSLGAINLEEDDHTGRGREMPVVAGQPARGQVRLTAGTPFKFVFLYSGNGDVTFRAVTLRRVE